MAALLVLLLLAGVITAGAFVAIGGIRAPDWVRQRVEARLNANLPDMHLSIGDIRLAPLGRDLNPVVRIAGIELRDAQGNLRAALPQLAASFAGSALLQGKLWPVSISMEGARIRMRREANGRFDVSIGRGENAPETAPQSASGSVGEIMDRVDAILALPFLSRLERIESKDVDLRVDDQMSGRRWVFTKGDLTLLNMADELRASVNFALENRQGADATASFGLRWNKKNRNSEFSTRFSGLKTRDLADQVAAFDWLRVLDAPLGASMTLDLGPDGKLGRMHGALNIGAGKLRQPESAPPVTFRGASAYLSYDPEKQKFTFDEITLDTDAAHVKVEGHAYLSDRIDRSVGGLIGQFRFTQLVLDPKGFFDKPLEFDVGAVDLRLRLDPLSVDIGQMVLVDKDTRYRMSGRLSAGPQGWTSALDLNVDDIPIARIAEIWPLVYKPKTRQWIVDNIHGGNLNRVTAAFRARPGQSPEITAGFGFHDLKLHYMKTQPPIEEGKGYGTWRKNRLQVVLEEGVVNAPKGGQVNLAGTRFTVPDTRIKGAPAELELRTRSSITAMMSVLDLPPFQYLSKADLPTDLAQGVVTAKGSFGFPLVEVIEPQMVRLNARAQMRRVRSDKIVKGKILTADRLDVQVDNTGITIAGKARLGIVPVSAAWRQDFGPEHRGHSTVTGKIELSQKFLREFAIALPEGSVAGKGEGSFVINLDKGRAPRFSLESDLTGLALRLDAVGWTKKPRTPGRLEVKGAFSAPPMIPLLRLAGPGFSAAGKLVLNRDGSLKLARFDKVDVGGWMKTAVELRPAGKGLLNIAIDGGEIDFRKSRFGISPSKPGEGSAISARLDRLILSRGITLTKVTGSLNTSGGLNGSFEGLVNGQARIIGVLAPSKGGSAVRFASSDAGAVLRAAGVFSSAHGGRMDLRLWPGQKPGHYRGTMNIRDTRVKNASGLADLLSAISIVGLLEQLNGDGIAFNNVDASFLLTPSAVELTKASAVGASMGLTMEGVYDFAGRSINMQGVITPIYMLNGLLEQSKLFGRLFGKQKGEGLLGFNYTLKGDVNKPRVGVNPLSILTPGLFREIFRQPMPQLGDDKTRKPVPPAVSGGGDR
ncbi:MAG: AsmA-like C-terminal domain-containing protein [Paracoccaceae bacterium]|nr:AsmA-like C-terminal domain-containing protein [Paracoccaceae bacterium]